MGYDLPSRKPMRLVVYICSLHAFQSDFAKGKEII